MLQIISGKFFVEGEELIEKPVCKVLYSNYGLVLPARTPVATLDAIDRGRSVTQYLLEYVSRLPVNQGSPNFRIVSMGDSTVVEQFRLLCVFGLRAYFSTEREDVARNCRAHPVSGHDRLIPANYVRRYFDPKIDGTPAEVDQFVSFVTKVIGLPRASYEKIIACLTNYADALEVLNYNIDLAYSMLVYSLEALIADFDAFTPTWDDYTDSIKGDLDTIFAEIPDEKATRIRETLIRHKQFRLQRRFIAFINAHLSESFFTEGAFGARGAIRPSELPRALLNVYQARSNYVHSLKSIQAQMKERGIADCEVFHWMNEPYLTFSGLSRLTYEVIREFIDRQPLIQRENYPWRQGLPDTITLPLSAELWIDRPQTATAADVAARLSALFGCFVDVFLGRKPIPDMRPVLAKYRNLIPQSGAEEKLNMFSAYVLWTANFPQHLPADDAVQFIEQNESLLQACSIQAMATLLMTENGWTWPGEVCAATYGAYQKRRIKPNALNLPIAVELAVMLEIANVFHREGNTAERDAWLDSAKLDAAGMPDLQQRIKQCQTLAREFSVLEEMFPKPSSVPDLSGNEASAGRTAVSIQSEPDQPSMILKAMAPPTSKAFGKYSARFRTFWKRFQSNFR